MELGLHHDPDLEPKRAKTLFISVCFHIALFAFLLLNPDLFVQMPKRFVRIGGQDYDLSKNQVTELLMPQQQRPRPSQPEKPLVQPPAPEPQQQAALTPPPPPPPPPPKESPVITPDMTLSENARLDGTPKASAGNTEELRAGGGGTPDVPKPATPKAETGRAETPQPNTNPNALTLKDLADRVMKQSANESQPRFPGMGRQGPRTGVQNPTVQENPDFSTEDPKILSPTYGYNFDPYLNQVINRIRYNWYALIPEIARFRRGKVVIIFTIDKSGTVVNPHIAANSGTDPLDRAAFGSITASNPFPRMPADFVGDHLDLQITFLYNINP